MKFLLRSVAVVIVAAAMVTSPVAAADIAGDWDGTIEIPGSALTYKVTFELDSIDAWTGKIDIPAQNAYGLEAADVGTTEDSVFFAIAGIPGAPSFRGLLSPSGDSIAGTFTQGNASFPFTMTIVNVEEQAKEAAQLSEQLNDIRSFVDTTREAWKVPGIAVAIIKGDSVVLSEGFGYRNLEDSVPVTANTVFAIGSSTKAFTTAALATLVDEGLVEWDGPVHKYLPRFRLHDPFITEHATVRDLVTHRIGLPRHDVMWYSSPYSREELLSRLEYLEFTEGFRETFQYQNLMFMTAGYLAGQVAGTTWEDLVRERLIEPLGMSSVSFSVDSMQQGDSYSFGYEEKDDTLARLPYRNIDAIGPAGSINASVTDMAQWVRLHLNSGKHGDEEIISEAQMNEMHSMFLPIGRAGGKYHERLLTGYGLGWFVEAYRGHYYVHHGGNIDGFSALVSFFPNDGLGMVLLTNKNATPLTSIVSHYISDVLLGLEPVDYNGRARLAMDQADSAQVESKEETPADRVEDTKPSHELKAYAGDYEHAAYGIVHITYDDDQLRAQLHDLESPMEHWHYDVFRVTEPPLGGERDFVTFSTNAAGDINELRVLVEPTLPPMVFSRIPDKSLSAPEYLKQFTGDYTLQSTTVTVALQADQLTLTVPGQPTYTLVPYKENEFTLKDLSGFSIVFEMDDGNVTAAKFKQPNGVFTAERVEE